MKIRDKKNFTKKLHGENFSVEQFSWAVIFRGAFFQDFKLLCRKTGDIDEYLLE